MRFAGGTLASLVVFILAAGAGYLIVTHTDWLGQDWRVAPLIGLLGYLLVRIITAGARNIRG